VPVGQLLDLYTTIKALDGERERALEEAERRARIRRAGEAGRA